MNLEDCTQPMPTQVPTKALPITCEWVNITFSCNPDRKLATYVDNTACIVASYTYDDDSTSQNSLWGPGAFWESRIERREFLQNDAAVVEVFKRPDEIPYYNVTTGLKQKHIAQYEVCLVPGQYRFVFNAEAPGMTGVYSLGDPFYVHYRVESNGKVIAQQQVTMADEAIHAAHEFDMPFDSAESPTGGPLTPKPTVSPTTTTPPTATSSPTSLLEKQSHWWYHQWSIGPTISADRAPTGASLTRKPTYSPTIPRRPSFLSNQSISVPMTSPLDLSTSIVPTTKVQTPSSTAPSTVKTKQPHMTLPFPTFLFKTWPPTTSIEELASDPTPFPSSSVHPARSP
jgi:hypothetical protein